jgi:hypothetical protein
MKSPRRRQAFDSSSDGFGQRHAGHGAGIGIVWREAGRARTAGAHNAGLAPKGAHAIDQRAAQCMGVDHALPRRPDAADPGLGLSVASKRTRYHVLTDPLVQRCRVVAS